jgi:hypothetical protein
MVSRTKSIRLEGDQATINALQSRGVAHLMMGFPILR